MNTCPNCGKMSGIHSSILQGCMCQYSMQEPPHDIDLFWRAVTTPEKWVGLTAEEVLQCWEKAHEPGNEGLINAIRMADEVEQALKEKNT